MLIVTYESLRIREELEYFTGDYEVKGNPR